MARGQPSTMVTAREACRDEKRRCLPQYIFLHDFHHVHNQMQNLCLNMTSNSKMLDFPCIFKHFSKIFKNFMKMSKHIIGWNFFHRIFPDLSFAPPETTIGGFRMRASHPNLTTGSRSLLDFTVPTVHILA